MELSATFLNRIIQGCNIKDFNPMQQATLAANQPNANMVLLAPTGSGKTIAFLLPLLQHIQLSQPGTQALIVVPSRELALQIEQVFKKMSTGLKITCCYGGHLRETEENNLIEAPTVIVGTPGRICDHLRRGNIHPQTITTLVLDEFDKMTELGFQEELAFIIQSIPALQQRILTSATDAQDLPDFIGLTNPIVLNYLTDAPKEMLAIQQVISTDRDKADILFRLICKLGNRSTVVFCNHRESVERTSTLLTEKGIVNVFYHGAMEQQQRDNALCKFKNGTSNVLVTTDLAARGLDIPNIRYIIHYHLPHTEDIFTHRNGRTARMDASGTAILIIGPEEEVPAYVPSDIATIELPETATLPDKPSWSTLFIAAGKKDKVNKIDIVGFLTQQGNLKKEDVGLIEVKDYTAFVAIRKIHMAGLLQSIKNAKIKNKKVKIDIAR
jgi:superfamily II DNA/RNA helicase